MGIYQKLDIATPDNILKYMDLVAVGTIADIVPLVDENRIYASIGLQHLIEKKNLGMNALISISNMNQKTLDTTDIVFGIAPGDQCCRSHGQCCSRRGTLDLYRRGKECRIGRDYRASNSLRQQEDQKTFHEICCDIIDKKYKDLNNTSCMVISSDDWHQGVIGIVASKLVEKYYRPVIMISFKDGFGSGSETQCCRL